MRINRRHWNSVPLGYEPSDSELARLSSAAYLGDFTQRNARAPRGYEIDPELSGGNHSVYRHRRSNASVVVFRGTSLNDGNDLLADFGILSGNRLHKGF